MEKGSKKHMHTHSNLTVKIVWVSVFLGFDTLQITIKTEKKSKQFNSCYKLIITSDSF